MKVNTYYVGAPVLGMCKQYAIWASDNGSTHYPIMYLQKPKHVNEAKWDEMCQAISLTLPKGFEC